MGPLSFVDFRRREKLEGVVCREGAMKLSPRYKIFEGTIGAACNSQIRFNLLIKKLSYRLQIRNR